MCQLLGMNCNVPTDIVFSFSGFQQRGGLTDVHKDGWGIAFFEGKGVRLFLDHAPSAHSPVADLVRQYPIKATNVVSHIRKATQGRVALENTHPFCRELWGRYWIFAHNGNLPEFNVEFDGAYRPVGETDSERAFCYILQEFKRTFGEQMPSEDKLFECLTKITLDLGARGEFNFLLSNGDMLLAHCSTRLSWIVREAPFRSARLKDQEMEVDFSLLTQAHDRVAVIATVPLTTDETWTELAPGTLCLFKDGQIKAQIQTVAREILVT